MITIPDYLLFKENNYDLLLQKYQPMIQNESRKYSYLKDNSIDFDDMVQENMIIAWDAIKYIQSKIKDKSLQMNEKVYFGPFLKQRLASYSRARVNKQKSQINQKLDSIYDISYELDTIKELTITDKSNYGQQSEYKMLYNGFVENLSKRERKLINALEKFKSYNKVSKKTKIPYNTVRSMSRDLKSRCKEFIVNQGYSL
jgi:DNA-directed RNA polymerase specialized sigma24 family protein